VNVNAKQLAEADFEVDLALEGDAKTATEVLFKFDLTYSGFSASATSRRTSCTPSS
jgi:preprotein translocase subunit SecB